MKNVSITVAPFFNPSSTPPTSPRNIETSYTISVSAQFDDEDEALKFASFLIGRIRGYKAENPSQHPLGIKS